MSPDFGSASIESPSSGATPGAEGRPAHRSTPVARIAVLIPTFRRPALLLAALDSLAAQTLEDFPIIVADNDFVGQQGLSVVNDWLKAGRRKDVLAFPVPESGLSANRNAGLAMAFRNFDVEAVLMIDDDTIAAPGLVARMSDALAETDADVIGGPTIYVFPGETPSYIRGLEMFEVPFDRTGPVPRLRSANNCMIRRRLFEDLGPVLFSPEFSRSGGEDSFLFRRMEKTGRRFWWVADAESIESIPATRCADDWLVARNRMSAMNSARIAVLLEGRTTAIRKQALMAGKEVLGGAHRWLAGVALGVLSRIRGSGSSVGIASSANRLISRQRFAGAAARIGGVLGSAPVHDDGRAGGAGRVGHDPYPGRGG